MQTLVGNRAVSGLAPRPATPGLDVAAIDRAHADDEALRQPTTERGHRGTRMPNALLRAALFASGNRATAQLARFLDKEVQDKIDTAAHAWEEAADHVRRFDKEIDSAISVHDWDPKKPLMQTLNANAISKATNAAGQGSAMALEVVGWEVRPPSIEGPGGTKGSDIWVYQPGSGSVSNRGRSEVKIAQSLKILRDQLATAYRQVGAIGEIEVTYRGLSTDLNDLGQWKSKGEAYQVGPPQAAGHVRVTIECDDGTGQIGVRKVEG